MTLTLPLKGTQSGVNPILCYNNFASFFVLMGLGESNSQMVSLTDELSQKNEELVRHQEEIAQLLSQIVELQHRVKEVG